jgi:mRNA-degrading endonuclease toxin of MazEF toxin-antitoxin module
VLGGDSMKTETIKSIDSYLASIKSDLLANMTDEEALQYVKWSQHKLSQTIKDRKEKKILADIKKLNPTTDGQAISKLRNLKKKYLPSNYPYNLEIGDIVYVNFGFGFCSELSDGHYGIVLSELIANMYLILPLSSEELRKYPMGISDLGLPNAQGIQHGKISYLRFDQLRYLHYRRLEKIINVKDGIVKLSPEQLKTVYTHLTSFLNFPVDKK